MGAATAVIDPHLSDSDLSAQLAALAPRVVFVSKGPPLELRRRVPVARSGAAPGTVVAFDGEVGRRARALVVRGARSRRVASTPPAERANRLSRSRASCRRKRRRWRTRWGPNGSVTLAVPFPSRRGPPCATGVDSMRGSPGETWPDWPGTCRPWLRAWLFSRSLATDTARKWSSGRKEPRAGKTSALTSPAQDHRFSPRRFSASWSRRSPPGTVVEFAAGGKCDRPSRCCPGLHRARPAGTRRHSLGARGDGRGG